MAGFSGQGAAQGAAAGTAIMPGWGTAIGGVMGAFMGGGGGGVASSPGASLKSEASAAVYGSGLDSSDWAVNFSGVQNAGSNSDKTLGEIGGMAASVPGWAWLAIGAAVVWKISRSKK